MLPVRQVGARLIYDPDREAEADVVFAGARLRPESMVFLLTQVCGHTTVPCDRERLDRLEIGPMPGAGDRHGTAYHVSVDVAAGLPAVAAICEVMGPGGHMLTGSAVERFALAWSLPLISIRPLAAHL
jgi:3,4-dihydroxy-2-butanone 4-phosphate synthase